MIRRGKNPEKIKEVILVLASGNTLDIRYKDHALSGKLSGFRDCHIDPDWLMIYRIEADTLYLERTGSHSDLF
jgi:mRNA interferase YafQ